jgi:hypothetical protein
MLLDTIMQIGKSISFSGKVQILNHSRGTADLSKVDILALGGEDQVTPMADAIKCGHIHVVEKLIDHILENGKDNSCEDLKKILEIKTRRGKNAYDLAIETKDSAMIDIIKKAFEYDKEKQKSPQEEKQKTQKNTFQSVFSEAKIRRYWTLCATYFYKYSATYRLHVTKLLIKRLAHLANSYSEKTDEVPTSSSEKEFLAFSDKRKGEINSSLLTEFSYKRSSETVATDIRTFWKLQRRGRNPALSILLNT